MKGRRNCVVSVLSHFSRVQLLVTLWTIAYHAPLSKGFSRQKYWSGLPFPSPGYLPNPGLLHCRWILYQLSHKGSPRILERVAYLFSSRSSRLRNRTGVSCIAGGFFTSWAIRGVCRNCRHAYSLLDATPATPQPLSSRGWPSGHRLGAGVTA